MVCWSSLVECCKLSFHANKAHSDRALGVTLYGMGACEYKDGVYKNQPSSEPSNRTANINIAYILQPCCKKLQKDRAENGERDWGDTLINYAKHRKNPDCFEVYGQCCTKTEMFVRVIVLLFPQLSPLLLSGTAGYQSISGSRKFRKEWPGHSASI